MLFNCDRKAGRRGSRPQRSATESLPISIGHAVIKKGGRSTIHEAPLVAGKVAPYEQGPVSLGDTVKPNISGEYVLDRQASVLKAGAGSRLPCFASSTMSQYSGAR